MEVHGAGSQRTARRAAAFLEDLFVAIFPEKQKLQTNKTCGYVHSL